MRVFNRQLSYCTRFFFLINLNKKKKSLSMHYIDPLRVFGSFLKTQFFGVTREFQYFF